MTALTQSELDTLQQEINAHVSALNAHIAQLTAERDEVKAECKAEASRAEVAEDYFNDAAKGLRSRIAELEAALLKSDALQDLAYADGAHRALVASNGGAPEEKIMAMISDRRHSSLVELKRLRENPSIAELEAQASAQPRSHGDFVIGDTVIKTAGRYHPPGTFRGYVATEEGDIRVVVQHDYGMLHIYSPEQIKRHTPTSQPSAQFVAGKLEGLRRAAEIARTFGDVYGACDFIASDILAEAALKD